MDKNVDEVIKELLEKQVGEIKEILRKQEKRKSFCFWCCCVLVSIIIVIFLVIFISFFIPIIGFFK